MDRPLIEEKLESLRRCVVRVEKKRPETAAVLKSDADRQDILSLNLTRAVQVCIDIAAHLLADTEQAVPDTMAGTFKALAASGIISTDLAERMTKAVGFRNIAVHSYHDIDWDIVFSICTDNLRDFKQFAAVVLTYLMKTR